MRLCHLPFGKKNVSMLEDTVRIAPILSQSSIETRKQYIRVSRFDSIRLVSNKLTLRYGENSQV